MLNYKLKFKFSVKLLLKEVNVLLIVSHLQGILFNLAKILVNNPQFFNNEKI